jgi:hypothetical protein
VQPDKLPSAFREFAVSEITREREVLAGRVGTARRWGRPNAELERDLTAVLLAEHVEKVVGHAPPLTTEQIDRITAILHGSVARPAARKTKLAAKPVKAARTTKRKRT